MSNEREAELLVRGTISELSIEKQEEVEASFRQLKQIVDTGPEALLAFCLLGSVIAQEKE